MSPAYERGRFSYRFEETLHRFQNMIIDKVEGDEQTRYRIPEGDEHTSLIDLPRKVLVATPGGTAAKSAAPEAAAGAAASSA